MRCAPDVMVIFGVEPGSRDNYRIHLGSFHREMARRLIISLIKQRLIFARAGSKVHSKFGVADLRYDGLRNWDILELKVVD